MRTVKMPAIAGRPTREGRAGDLFLGFASNPTCRQSSAPLPLPPPLLHPAGAVAGMRGWQELQAQRSSDATLPPPTRKRDRHLQAATGEGLTRRGPGAGVPGAGASSWDPSSPSGCRIGGHRPSEVGSSAQVWSLHACEMRWQQPWWQEMFASHLEGIGMGLFAVEAVASNREGAGSAAGIPLRVAPRNCSSRGNRARDTHIQGDSRDLIIHITRRTHAELLLA